MKTWPVGLGEARSDRQDRQRQKEIYLCSVILGGSVVHANLSMQSVLHNNHDNHGNDFVAAQ